MSAPVFIPFLGAFTTAAAASPATGAVRRPSPSPADRRFRCRPRPLPLGAGPALRLLPGDLRHLAQLLRLPHHSLQPGADAAAGWGRIASSISKWFNLAGLVIIGALLASQLAGAAAINPILLLIFLVGCYSVWVGSTPPGREPRPPAPAPNPVRDRRAYVALLAVSALLMS